MSYKSSIDLITPELTVPNFGLSSTDHNYQLLHFLPRDVLSSLPLLDFQIDLLADLLNWEIISKKQLSGWLFIKHKDKINWEVFIKNGHPKEINALIDVKDKLLEHAGLFFIDDRIKKLYLNSSFISTFPTLVDWNWCVRHLLLTEYIILRNWSKFDKAALYLQKFSKKILVEKVADFDWCMLATHQKLDEDFILQNYEEYIRGSREIINAICKWQVLTEKFIIDNARWLSMGVIAQYQDLSFAFIIRHGDILPIECLAKNNNFNKIGSVQIFSNATGWYVIDAPVVVFDELTDNSRNINYCIIDSIE